MISCSSYGFYLMQYITIYSFMPHIVLALEARGNSYWDIVTPTLIICFLINLVMAWIAYHLFDRVGLKLGKWIWDGLFVTKSKNFADMPKKAVLAFWNMCKTQPGKSGKGFVEGCKNAWGSIKYNTWIIFHWRSPVRLFLSNAV